VIETPFGPGRILEEEKDYKVDIDARKSGLTRMGGLIGRIVDVNDRVITVDYRYPFGGETLVCDVTVEKVLDAKSVKSDARE
jgi:FKBP-type peptidyl-prolyl cis-trans isomerase 2